MIRCNVRNEEMAEEEYPPRVCFFRSSYDYDSFIDGGKKISRSIRKGTLFLFYHICRTCIDIEENSIDAI